MYRTVLEPLPLLTSDPNVILRASNLRIDHLVSALHNENTLEMFYNETYYRLKRLHDIFMSVFI